MEVSGAQKVLTAPAYFTGQENNSQIDALSLGNTRHCLQRPRLGTPSRPGRRARCVRKSGHSTFWQGHSKSLVGLGTLDASSCALASQTTNSRTDLCLENKVGVELVQCFSWQVSRRSCYHYNTSNYPCELKKLESLFA
jgi:hypothetical protein